MTKKKVLGWVIFGLGIPCSLSCMYAVGWCIYDLVNRGEEALYSIPVAVVFSLYLVMLGFYTVGGWLLAHPAKGIKHRNTVGCAMLIVGSVLIISSTVTMFEDPWLREPYVIAALVLVFGTMALGGWWLTHPLKGKGSSELTPQLTDEPADDNDVSGE
jgi:hypothetical protein